MKFPPDDLDAQCLVSPYDYSLDSPGRSLVSATIQETIHMSGDVVVGRYDWTEDASRSCVKGGRVWRAIAGDYGAITLSELIAQQVEKHDDGRLNFVVTRHGIFPASELFPTRDDALASVSIAPAGSAGSTVLRQVEHTEPSEFPVGAGKNSKAIRMRWSAKYGRNVPMVASSTAGIGAKATLDSWFMKSRPRRPLEGALRLRLSVVLPHPKSVSKKKAGVTEWKATAPDVDAYVSSVMDSLERCGWMVRDSQVTEVMARKCYGEAPEVAVQLREVRHVCAWF